MMLSYEEKISSINVDPVKKKLYVGFESGNIVSS